MLSSIAKTSVRIFGWLALAYLGYWTAVFLDDVFLRLTVFPLLGAPLLDWRLTPFRAFVNNGDLGAILVPGTPRSLLPLVPELVALMLVAAFGKLLRSPLVRVWCHSAGLWLVALLTGQLAFLAYLGRGRFVPLLNFLASNPQAMGLRVACVVVGAAALVLIGALFASRLLKDAPLFFSPCSAPGWKHLPLFVTPFLLILCGTFGFSFRLLGTRAILLLLIPSAFCLLLGCAGLYRIRRAARRLGQSPELAPAVVTLQSSAAAFIVAALLYIGLAGAERAEAVLLEQRLASFSSPHYDIRYDPQSFSREFIGNFAAEREKVFEHLASRLQFADDQFSTADRIHLRVVLYGDFPAKRSATGSDHPYNIERTTIRALLHGHSQRLDPAADAAALLNGAWGAPSSPRIGEWVARLLAGEWRGETIEHWAARIENASAHYTLEELLQTNGAVNVSPYVRAPLGAAWIRRVYDQRGLSAVQGLYSRSQPQASLQTVATLLGTTPAELERDWSAWTQQLRAQDPGDPPPVKANTDFFFRGISFSHEGWGGRRGGYTDPAAYEQLHRLKEWGANAIAVVPYGFMRDPGEPVIGYTSTDETDEELVEALHLAHGFGMKVMLKPQLW